MRETDVDGNSVMVIRGERNNVRGLPLFGVPCLLVILMQILALLDVERRPKRLHVRVADDRQGSGCLERDEADRSGS